MRITLIDQFLKYDAEFKTLNFNKVFTEKELSRYEEMFKYFDRTGKGTISREDFPTAIRALGVLVTTFELRELASYLDPDRTQKMNMKQFLIGVYALRGRKPNQNEIYNSLKVFDRTSTGRIQVEEMKQILMNIGDIVNPNEFDAVFSELEMDRGFVTIDELVELLTIS